MAAESVQATATQDIPDRQDRDSNGGADEPLEVASMNEVQQTTAADALDRCSETETAIPCARTVDNWLPCLALFMGPCCCCIKSQPDWVCVPFDFFTERVYDRPLTVVTFVCFTWRAFVAYFVTLAGIDPTEFSLCSRNITSIGSFGSRNDDGPAVLEVAQSGLLGLLFATLVGLGNSRYEKRCWSWVSPFAAFACFSATLPAQFLCGEELSRQGNTGNFALYAGATSNFMSTCFFAVQLMLSVLLLVRRRKGCCGSGDGNWCGPMEFSEPLPVQPLAPRNPTPEGALTSGLLADHSEILQHQQITTELVTVEQKEPRRSKIPLRFWIAVTMSGTVVGFLAAMGALYGVFLTDRLRAWALASNADITRARAFLESIGGDEYLEGLLSSVSSGIGIIVSNFWAITAEERLKITDRYDFYWGFYFISFSTLNAAAAFLMVAAFCTLLSFTFYAPFLRQQLWFKLFLSSSIGSLIAGTIGRKVLFTGVVATKNTIRYNRYFRWMDFAYSFTLGPLSAVATVFLRYFALLLCSLSSLARLDQPLILPELSDLGLDVWEPGFAAWAGMLKMHYHSDVQDADQVN